MPLGMRRFNWPSPMVGGGCGHHPHGRVRAGHFLGLEPASGHPQKTASWAGRHPAPVCRHAGVPCMYPCGRSPRGFTAASALVIFTEFRAGTRLVVVPSRREADVDLFRTLGRAAKSRRTSACVQAQDRFHGTKAPPLTRVDGQLSSKNLALSSNVVPLCNAGERVSSLVTSGVDYIAEIEKKKN